MIKAAVFALVLCSCFSWSTRRNAERTARGTVIVLAWATPKEGNQVKAAQGSGAVVHDSPSLSFVLTCAHVVEGRDVVLVSPDSPLPDLPGKVVKIDTVNDLALVAVNGSLGGEIPVAQRAPRLYEQLEVAGAPNTTRGTLFRATLSSYFHSKHGKPRWGLAGGTFYPGISGGPATFQGRLVCIVDGVDRDVDPDGEVLVQGLGYCIPLPAVRTFLADLP